LAPPPVARTWGLHPEFGEAAQAVVHAQGHALHGRPGESGRGEGLAGRTPKNTPGAVGHVGRPFAFEVGQQQQAVGPGGTALAAVFSKAAWSRSKSRRTMLGGDGDVHRAEQRQPAVGGIAERGDFALGSTTGLSAQA
jgi:hypothetical protein